MLSGRKLLLTCLFTAFSSCVAINNALPTSSTPFGTATVLSKVAPPGRSCAPTSSIPVAGANLTAEEHEFLDFICWDPNPGTSTAGVLDDILQNTVTTDGIPPGVSCTPTSWCDSGVCSEVCARGSVAIEPWMSNAVRLQARLARTLPFCFTCMFGTHNSAITLADGYGNLDPSYQALFKYVKWASRDFSNAILRTNNQWLSITDQMNLGVRMVEIDTHWVGGVLRVAHCGGLHVGPLNTLVKALNTIAKLIGHHIRWDTETMGCDPSLSSIPALLQRPLKEALQEVADWMADPANEDELVVLFFDDQPDLSKWGVVGKLKDELLSVFPQEMIFSQIDLFENGNQWPTGSEMVLSGKRLVLVSASDYGDDMAPIIFPRGSQVCQWVEPSLQSVAAAPECVLKWQKGAVSELFKGSIVRVSTCELEYGPLNCEFVWKGGNAPFFDEASIPGVVNCGVNVPSPDLLTPSRAASAVWTWAAGHPYIGGGDCAVISSTDGRWRTMPCIGSDSDQPRNINVDISQIPSICRVAGTPIDIDEQWTFGPRGGRGSCPNGTAFDIPRHPRENFFLATAMQSNGISVAWLPVQGPDWSIDGIPESQNGTTPGPLPQTEMISYI